MYDENQVVSVKWNNNNRLHYESLGYTYTKRYNEFFVPLKHLLPTSTARIKATCDYCGKEYETSYSVLCAGRAKPIVKDCCSLCTGKKAAEISFDRRKKKHMALANSVCQQNGYTLLTQYDDYTDAKMDIRFLCPKHGEQTMLLDNFIHGHRCIRCSYENRGAKKRHDTNYVKETIESTNGNIWLNPQDYKDMATHNLRVVCGSCGREFETSFTNYANHGVVSCFACSCKASNPERQIANFLDRKGVKYEQEKRFADCKDKRTLPFDFYLPEENAIIEFDGPHHYFPIRNNEEHHLQTFRHDKIKDAYCQQNSITLLRIPYWEYENLDGILAERLNI